MKKLLTPQIIILSFLVSFIGIQFIRIDTNNPKVNIEQDFCTVSKPSPELISIIKSSCYDCHSDETKYPWYSNIVPISWVIKKHIDEGKSHLNFSVWASYNEKKSDHKLEECVDEVKEGEMPMGLYTLFHPEARFTENQKNNLIDFFDSLRK